jgi:hypothetical protein
MNAAVHCARRSNSDSRAIGLAVTVTAEEPSMLEQEASRLFRFAEDRPAEAARPIHPDRSPRMQARNQAAGRELQAPCYTSGLFIGRQEHYIGARHGR